MTLYCISRALDIRELALIVSFAFAGLTVAAEPPQAIEFNRDVRPILADHCFQCHGPDAKQRKADLRLDTPEAGDAKREGGAVVVPGQPDNSELWRRINSTDPDERMPPPDKGGKLTAAEVATLKQWIIEGARFEKHWSLLPVRRPLPPHIQARSVSEGFQGGVSIQNSIDAFVLARLEKEGLSPSPPADRSTLLRRVTLALTGLPPTPSEVEAYLADRSPDVYERAVDRLLASPRYGERMAVPWLDAARYADTSGYQSDGERFMWRWRDWVIEALNGNMPFDQFTIEQIAGDLIPNPTLEQRIATGFNRNHRGNAEGGIIPEEYAVEYVADRVETTATVWLGLTLGCCRCHDHKYDPFTQRDFYSLFAFFNNVPEKGRAIKFGNSPPYIQAPTRWQQGERRRLEEQCEKAEEAYVRQAGDLRLAASMRKWEDDAKHQKNGDWQPTEQLIAHFPFDGETTERQSGKNGELSGDGCRFISGPVNRAAEFNGNAVLVAGEFADFGFFSKFTLSAWIRADDVSGGTIVSRMNDVPQGEGYQLAIVDGKLQFNLVKRWLDDALRVETAGPTMKKGWHHVAATYDGSRVADGVRIYIDGQPQKLRVLLDELNQSFATKEPLRIGGGGGAEMRLRGALADVRVYGEPRSWGKVQVLAAAESLDDILAKRYGDRSDAEWAKLTAYFLNREAPEPLRSAHREREEISRRFDAFMESLPTVMVMEELPEPRPTHVLIRGQYDKPGERVEPNVPAELPPLPADASRNRLELARWLVAAENPLTSRVIVNRAWQLHFGTGIVKTAEDFGRQGEWPSHPELLDWLAAEFSSGWDVKGLHRRIVESATYRQSSANSEFRIQNSEFRSDTPHSTLHTSHSSDAENRLLSRGPRLRLSAEMIRDQALFASGLLVEQLGGPSVRPLQPAGLWSELTGGEDYQPGSGAERYRRSLYTFWKRTIPPPTLATFDSPSREACVVRESRTNTPLQALALLNEPTFVAAAQALAERVINEADTPRDRIERATMSVLGRKPTQEEQQILLAALQRYRGAEGVDEKKACALVCNTILNLDEAVTSQ